MLKRYLPNSHSLIWAALGLFTGIVVGVCSMVAAVDPVMLKNPVVLNSSKGCIMMWVETADPLAVGYRQVPCKEMGHAD